MSAVHTLSFPPPPVNEREVLRYAGIRQADAGTKAAVAQALEKAAPVLEYRVCFAVFPVAAAPQGLDLGFCKTASRDLAKNLARCGSVVLFAATVGMGLDRLIRQEGLRSPAGALYLQAMGSERVEALCDAFNDEIRRRAKTDGQRAHPRYSPGYGDLPLEVQRQIFAALDPPRRIGVFLRENCMMTPAKSVTALIGLETVKQE